MTGLTSLFLFLALFGQEPQPQDIRPYLQAAINVSINNPARRGWGRIEVENDVYNVSDTILIDTCIDVHIAASHRAVLRWTGPNDGRPVFKFKNAHTCKMTNISIDFISHAGSGVELTNEAGRMLPNSLGILTGYICTNCLFTDVIVGDNRLHGCDYAFNMWNPEGADSNNELHKFVRCHALGCYDIAAWRVHGSQIHGLHFQDCVMEGGRVGNADGSTTYYSKYGILCEYGAYIDVDGMTGGYHQICDVMFGAFHIRNRVSRLNSENSGGWVHSTGNGTNPSPLLIENCRLESNRLQGYGIAIQHVGPLTVRGCVLNSSNGRPQIHAATYTFPAGGGSVRAEDNAIGNAGAAYTTDDPFIVADRTTYVVHESGNVFVSPDGIPTRGDQTLTSQGQAVATPTQTGSVTTVAQSFAGAKTLLNPLNLTTGIRVRGEHEDGRTRIESLADGAGISFWNRWNRINIDPNVILGMPNNVDLFSGTAYGLGPGQTAFNGGANYLKIASSSATGANAIIDMSTMRYASPSYPSLRHTAPKYTWHAPAGNWPEGPASGPEAMRLDATGLYLSVPLKIKNAAGEWVTVPAP